METTRLMTCDFYTQEQWNAAAAQAAALMHEHVFDRNFGVSPWFVNRYFVFYGNEGPANVAAMIATVRQEIEMIRGMREVGVGTAEDGYSWAIIVNAENVMAGGVDEVREIMQEAIGRAWRIAKGFLADDVNEG